MLLPRSLTFLAIVLVASTLYAESWRPLFNGASFEGWTTQNGKPVTAEAWKVEPDGAVHLDTSNGRGGNILTDREYGDFELVFEWKISDKGNNGIKYRVNDFDGRVLGCEYQVIDDATTNQKPKHRTASLYDVYEPMEHQLLKPAGEWNRGAIIVSGNRIEHYLNGYLVMSAIVGSDEWNDRMAKSKFHDVEQFGRTPVGKIMITDHRDAVSYRNMFIREIGPSSVASHSDGGCSTCNVWAPKCCSPRRKLFGRRACR